MTTASKNKVRKGSKGKAKKAQTPTETALAFIQGTLNSFPSWQCELAEKGSWTNGGPTMDMLAFIPCDGNGKQIRAPKYMSSAFAAMVIMHLPEVMALGVTYAQGESAAHGVQRSTEEVLRDALQKKADGKNLSRPERLAFAEYVNEQAAALTVALEKKTAK